MLPERKQKTIKKEESKIHNDLLCYYCKNKIEDEITKNKFPLSFFVIKLKNMNNKIICCKNCFKFIRDNEIIFVEKYKK